MKGQRLNRLAVPRCYLLFILGMAASSPQAARAAIPSDELIARLERPSTAVDDRAGLLDETQRQALEQRSRELLQSHGAALVIVTLPSLEGGQIDDFAQKLFQKWGIGDEKQDKGLLLLVAMQDRKARIEVGYGLEPILPDALAGRILDDILLPAFRRQEYAQGIQAAAERMAVIIERNEPPRPEELQRHDPLANRVVMALFLALFVGVGGFLMGVGLGARVAGMFVFGALFVGLPFIVGLGVAMPLAPVLHPIVALVAGWFGQVLGRQSPTLFRGSRAGRSGQYGGAYMPWIWSSPSGSSSSSSWSGGGFSSSFGGFGGGSSGGGGASGGW